MSAQVAVVTVSYHSAAALPRFIDSLADATTRELDMVVVDNADDDELGTVLAERSGIRIVCAGANLGYGAAANLGVRETVAQFVVVANPDIVWEAGSLDALLAATDRWPRAAAFGPLIRTPDGVVYPSARAVPSLGRGIGHALFGWWWPTNPWTAAYRVERTAPTERTAGWLSGSCLLLRRDAFDAVGGFDPAYFMYFEDLDLGERLSRAGWQNVYVPTAAVTHTGGHSTALHAQQMAVEHHRSAWRYLSHRYRGRLRAPIRWVLHAGLLVRARLAERSRRIASGAPPRGVDVRTGSGPAAYPEGRDGRD